MSLLEELRKNDLYEPYANKLDELLKGGPGSGPQGGKQNSYSKRLHNIAVKSGYKYQGKTANGTRVYKHPSGATAMIYDRGSIQMSHSPAGGGFLDHQEFSGPNDSALIGGLNPYSRYGNR